MKTVADILKPRDRAEEEIYAIELLVENVQAEIVEAMDASGVTQTELAERMGVTKARVSHLLGDKARNVTLATVGKVFHALGQEAQIIREGKKCHTAGKRLMYLESKSRSANENWPTAPSDAHVNRNKSSIHYLEKFQFGPVVGENWNDEPFDKCA